MRVLRSILVILTIQCQPILATQSSLKITWVVSDTPPFHISNGSLANQGICDGLVRELQSNIDNVQFETQLVPQARIGKMLAAGERVCFPCMIYKAQSTDRIVYSQPSMVFPPFVIISTKAFAKKLKKGNDSIDIVELMNNPSYKFGKEVARKYGELHSIISPLPAFRNAIFSHNSNESTTAIAELMSRGRIDYTIDYPTTLELFKKRGYNNLTYIPIKQAEQFIVGAIGCSAQNPEFSTEALKVINEALKTKVINSESYQKHLDFWMSEYPNYQYWYDKKVLQKNRN